jgi:hypothetical protein
MRRAHAEASLARVEIDIEGNGQAAYCFALGTTNSRYT